MDANKQYKCVNCGEPAAALYKTYGPSVLKLTKCEKCNGIVDKYIEYDPVIVMIDLVLVSKEAQRHVLYNTEFKSYWKLFIILLMIETYGLWHNNSIFNIVVNSMCGIQTSTSTLNASELFPVLLDVQVPESLRNQCWGWMPEARVDEIYLWEEDFYVMFISTFTGVVAFIITVHISMMVVQSFVSQNSVRVPLLLKAFSLGNASALLCLPAAVWAAAAGGARALAALYGLAVFHNTFTVLYECPAPITMLILAASNIVKFMVTYHSAPLTRELLKTLRNQELELL